MSVLEKTYNDEEQNRLRNMGIVDELADLNVEPILVPIQSITTTITTTTATTTTPVMVQSHSMCVCVCVCM